MKFSISRAKFVDGLKSVQNIVGSKVSIPVLQNVRLEANDQVLRLTTTDLDISINSTIECDVQEPGATTLPVKILFNMVSCAAEGLVEVEVDENEKASIRAGSAKYKLVGIPEFEFPKLPEDEGAYGYTLPQVVMKEMLRKTSYAASQDETRRSLRGVLMSFKNAKLTMVATDGRRLALVEKEIDFPAEATRDITLPTKAVQELQRSLGSEGDVIVRVQRSQICFTLGHVLIYSKLIDEMYPNYTQVIPVSCEQQIKVDRQLLISAMERVNVMTSDIHSVKLRFSDNLLVVSSATTEVGEAKDEVPIKYGGNEIEIMFNPTYVIEALKAIDDDEVVFNLNNGHSPAVIRCSIPFLYVIMPLRVN